MGPTKRGKGSKIMAVADGSGLPLAIHVGAASPAEVTLVDAVLADSVTVDAPERLIAWLQNFRRILVRHEYKLENYRAFVHLGCIRILLRQPHFLD